MKLNEYYEYIQNPLTEAKRRVVLLPPGEIWTEVRQFYKNRGDIELRLSELVKESAWLPMPDEVFKRVNDAMTAQEISGKALVLLGLHGYLALLDDENKRAAIIALREWVDGTCGSEAVCFLRSDDGTGLIIRDVFANPRYRQGKQLVEILADTFYEEEIITRRTEVLLVGSDLVSYIPETCDTFQKYLHYTEEYPNDSSTRRIVVASEGRELAGLSSEVRQVVCLRDFACVFYGVENADLSDDALRWMCAHGKNAPGKKLSVTLKEVFSLEDNIARCVLRVFDEKNGAEREALLWLIKVLAPQESYLKFAVSQEMVHPGNFRSAYVMGAAGCLDKSLLYANERSNAIREADVSRSDADVRQFIALCADESTSRVAPWLNSRMEVEHAELIRRCFKDGIVSNVVKDIYPEAAAYLNADLVFDDLALEEYFMQYRTLKMVDSVTEEIYEKVPQVILPESVQSRDAIVQRYALDKGCALLVVDGMGAEWLPMLVTLAGKRNLRLDSIAVGKANLPTSTIFNKINWPDTTRCLPDIKRFDNITHNGVEAHAKRCPEENLATEIDVISNEVLPRVAEGLARFERVLVTADHGSSRLAVLAWQTEPRLARTLTCEDGGRAVADWRYRERAADIECPPELEETLDGRHWVMRGYDRLPKGGGGQGFELHGGATPEERLVPVLVFSRTGQYLPKAKPVGGRAEIIEEEDFDL